MTSSCSESSGLFGGFSVSAGSWDFQDDAGPLADGIARRQEARRPGSRVAGRLPNGRLPPAMAECSRCGASSSGMPASPGDRLPPLRGRARQRPPPVTLSGARRHAGWDARQGLGESRSPRVTPPRGVNLRRLSARALPGAPRQANEAVRCLPALTRGARPAPEAPGVSRPDTSRRPLWSRSWRLVFLFDRQTRRNEISWWRAKFVAHMGGMREASPASSR
jgi:hypothetical protein